MSAKIFPTFINHQAARCFCCDAWLSDHKSSGFARGEGYYVAECEGGCGHRTWYDINQQREEIDNAIPI
jgi:hypothetical protein